MSSLDLLHQRPELLNPQVTIVISFRERWSLTLFTIDSIIANTQRPYRLCILDVGMPPNLLKRIAARCEQSSVPIEVFSAPNQWPNRARGRYVKQITTPYVVFLDNDVAVLPGWLDPLVSCAQQTGAGIVGPLYLWGVDAKSDRIHMAGGTIEIEPDGDKIVLRESHVSMNKTLGDIEALLRSKPCGFVEFHCLLMRRETAQLPDMFNDDIYAVHEHIHASLTARKAGFETWFEPAARVNYLAYSPWKLMDLPLRRQRWSRKDSEHSLKHFMNKWNVLDDDRSFGGIRGFIANHADEVDVVRVASSHVAPPPFSRKDLEQNLAGLLSLALARGYSQDALARLGRVARLAAGFCDGIYRPCGRPFFNHLIGTASVMVYYDLAPRLVMASLLHAAYTHRRLKPGGSYASDDEVGRRIKDQAGSAVDNLVRRYAVRSARYAMLDQRQGPPRALSVADAELFLMEAANTVDMDYSLEVAATGRQDVPAGAMLDRMISICQRSGLPGLALALTPSAQDLPQVPAGGYSDIKSSYVLDLDGNPKGLVFSRPEPVAALN